MRRFWFVAAWSVLVVGSAAALALWVQPPNGGAAGAWLELEPFHVACHTLLFAVLGAALAVAVCSGRPATRVQVVVAASAFALVALGQEVAQCLARGRTFGAEEVFDLGVDVLGGALGLLVWAVARPAHARRVARALSWLLHPALVAPLGLFALYWSALRSVPAALAWCAVALASCVPVAWTWIAGVRRGRFSDADLSVRRERRRFLAIGVAWSVLHLAAAWALGAPPIVTRTAACGVVGAVGITLVTRLGYKVSGHVAVAVGLAVALAVTSQRGPFLFAMAALLLTWACVRDVRHTPREVLGGWMLGAAAAGGLFLV